MDQEITDWQVGPWVVRPSLNQITGESGTQRTTPKVIATLLCLAKHQREVVSREMLLDTVWFGTVVSDDTLNKAISELRRILGDSPRNPQVIETIRQRGYRLLLPAQPILEIPKFDAKSVQTHKSAASALYARRAGLFSVVVLLCFFCIKWFTLKPSPTYRPIPLTTEPGLEFDVALSHDGEQIAYAVFKKDQRQIDLFVKQIGVETPQQLTNNKRIEMSPGWSPDGRSIAFLAVDIDGTSCGLYIITLLGGDERRVADCETFLVTGVSWSPDGKKIAFSDRKNRESPFRIYLLDIETRLISPVTEPPGELFGDFSATFSPNGKSIGFIRGTVAGTTALLTTPAVGDVYKIRLDDLSERRLTFENQEIPHIDWMPDGKEIVFASNHERGASGLWKVNVNGGVPEWMFSSHTFVRKPMVARKSNRLAFEQWVTEASIWQVALDSLEHGGRKSAQPLIHSTQYDVTPQYSPDGKHLAFTSKRSGASEIWISGVDGKHPMQLTSFGGPFTTSPRWSPDGSRLVFETRIDGQTDIYIVDVNGGIARRLTSNKWEDMTPSWSNDGQWIYFSSNRGGAWQIWKMPSEGGRALQVTTNGGYLPLLSPNKEDNMLYYTRIDSAGVYRMPLNGGVAKLIIPDLRADDWGNWLPAEKGIYALLRQPSRIIFYDYNTAEIESLGHLKQIPAGMIGLSVSPDNNTLAFVQQQHHESDIWMIDEVE